MKPNRLIPITFALFLLGCAGGREIQRIDALRADPGWPAIRTAAETEVARKEGNTYWSARAYYSPRQHTNGVWTVLASGSYPLNTLGDHIEMLIRDNGDVISYIPLYESHPR